ncbi:hypothetical protein TCAP_04718 [Tolypocladium capitatum]|uniref:Uncharacterized protein n=1 Tax=Tolypocladium capitatum TaxID=45235 RepID=A0A2K3QCT1_9HYPO|nr:hypothetical protein TCAP_04718 [Tolypocladium capitatum]
MEAIFSTRHPSLHVASAWLHHPPTPDVILRPESRPRSQESLNTFLRDAHWRSLVRFNSSIPSGTLIKMTNLVKSLFDRGMTLHVLLTIPIHFCLQAIF